MAKLTDALMREILAPNLPAGETIQHTAYGIKQPNMLYMLPAFALAILPGVILTQKLTKHYVVGVTEKTVLIAEVSPKWSTLAVAIKSIKSTSKQDLAGLKGQTVKNKSGGLFTKLAFPTDSGPFAAKFHRAFSKTNRPSAQAIGAAIESAA